MTRMMELAEPGMLLGQYEVIEHIGQGVTANVYKVYDHEREEVVALKRLHPNRVGPVGNTQLIHEAEVGRLVAHNAVVAMYDFHANSSGVTLSMQYVEGKTLEDVAEKDKLGEDDIHEIDGQLGGILDGLRDSRVIHRDIVPQNLIRNDDGLILCDFGSACTESESGQWRLPSLTLKWLRQYAPDSPGFMGSRRAFPLSYLLGAKPTYRGDEHAARLVIKELAGKVNPDISEELAADSSVGWQSALSESSP